MALNQSLLYLSLLGGLFKVHFLLFVESLGGLVVTLPSFFAAKDVKHVGGEYYWEGGNVYLHFAMKFSLPQTIEKQLSFSQRICR